MKRLVAKFNVSSPDDWLNIEAEYMVTDRDRAIAMNKDHEIVAIIDLSVAYDVHLETKREGTRG